MLNHPQLPATKQSEFEFEGKNNTLTTQYLLPWFIGMIEASLKDFYSHQLRPRKVLFLT